MGDTYPAEVGVGYETLTLPGTDNLTLSEILRLFDRVEHYYPTAVSGRKITSKNSKHTSRATWNNFRFKTQAVTKI